MLVFLYFLFIFVTYFRAFEVGRNFERKKFKRNAKARELISVHDQLCYQSSEKESLNGLEIIHALEWFFENGCPQTKRELYQKELHDKVIACVAPVFMGDDWATYGPAYMLSRAILKVAFAVLAVAPRRFGKSFAASMAMAIIMVFYVLIPQKVDVDKYEILILSQVARTASVNLDYINQFLDEMRPLLKMFDPQYACFVKRNSNQIKLKGINGQIARVTMTPRASSVSFLIFINKE